MLLLRGEHEDESSWPWTLPLVSALTATAGLAACGGSQSTANIPNATSPTLAISESRGRLTSPTSSYQVLYRFQKRSHGQHPASSLIDVNGTLYGTTLRGGSSGNGTVFSISSTGQEKALHSFRGGADGAWPRGNLLDVNGTLYGTTSRAAARDVAVTDAVPCTASLRPVRNTCSTASRADRTVPIHGLGSSM